MTPVADPSYEGLPWRWYCRLCGAHANSLDEINRDVAAFGHLEECPIAPKRESRSIEFAISGKLLHVWAW